MRSSIVEINRRLVLPALDESEDTVLIHTPVDGVENISFLSPGFFHEIFSKLNKLVDTLFLHQHLGKNFDHVMLLSFEVPFRTRL